MEPFEKLRPATIEGSKTLTNNIEQATAGAHKAINKASDAARPAVDRIASGAHHAVDKLAVAAGTLGSKGEKLKQVQVRLVEDARGYVRSNPVKSIGIAAATGYVLSRLLRSR